MKQRIILFSLFLFVLALFKATAQEKLYYVFSDSVEMALYQSIQCMDSDKEICLYITTSSKVDNNISMYLLELKDDNCDLAIFARQTNRYAIICSKDIPIVFDIDFRWGTTTSKDYLGNCGNREGLYKRSILIIDSSPIIRINK